MYDMKRFVRRYCGTNVYVGQDTAHDLFETAGAHLAPNVSSQIMLV